MLPHISCNVIKAETVKFATHLMVVVETRGITLPKQHYLSNNNLYDTTIINYNNKIRVESERNFNITYATIWNQQHVINIGQHITSVNDASFSIG